MRLNARRVFRLIPFAASVALAAMAACVNETGAITVSPGFEIGVTPDNPTIALGDSVALAVTLPSTLQASGASFTSANTAVAIARPNGWIIGVGRGRTNITVTAVADTKLSTSVSVLVGP